MKTTEVEIPKGNYGKPRELTKITTIVMHSTESDRAGSAVQWFKNPAAKVSAHFVIDTNGDVYKCVPVGTVAYHAGVSVGPDGSGCNKYSVGFEMAHMDGHGSFPPAQVAAVVELAKELKATLPNLKYITTHHIIAPKRKQDPVDFDTQGVADEVGLTFWKG